MDGQEKKRLLFVDDEVNLLQGLKRMLYHMRNAWDMIFVSSAKEALEVLSREPIDIIITDIRMPEVDGIELLKRVMVKYPHVIRFILSGQSSKADFVRAVGPSHQFLSKPVEAEALKSTINRALSLRILLAKKNLKRILAGIRSLPSLPSLYVELEHEIKSPLCSMKKVAQIVEKDVSMSAKVLKLVNSAFFGFRKQIANPSQAVVLLGLDIIQSLIFLAEIFPMRIESVSTSAFINKLWEHSMQVSMLSKKIAMTLYKDKYVVDEACKAGLFHDLGKLIILTQLPDAFRKILMLMKEKGIRMTEAEIKAIGVSHAEIGAYILGLWGFSDPIVAAVAYHCGSMEFDPNIPNLNAIVRIANIIVNEEGDIMSELIERIKTDNNYLPFLSGSNHIENWCDFYVNDILRRQ